MTKHYFISFVEECIMNEKFKDYVAGRIEVYDENNVSPWAIDEIRFFTNNTNEFNAFRDKWDFKTVGEDECSLIKRTTKETFYETLD